MSGNSRGTIMRKWARISAALVMGAVSVYSNGAGGANPEASAVDADSNGAANDVKVLDGAGDPEVPSPVPTSHTSPLMKPNPDGTFTLNITKDADILDTLRVIGYQAQ